MKEYLLKYIKDNMKCIKIFLLCFLVGLVIGVIAFQFIDNGTKGELVNNMKGVLELSKGENFDGINVIKNGIESNIVLSVIIYFAAITLLAPLLICSLNVFKGFSIGIYVSTIFSIFGFGNGLLVTLMLVIVPNLLYIPAYIYLCTNATNFHYQIIDRANKQNKMSIVIKETYKFIIVFSIMFLSVILEQLLSMGVISIYMKM